MRQYFQALAMCQSMFCAVPSPFRVWEEKARDKMLLFLPLVGLEIGLLWALATWLTRMLALPKTVAGVICCIFPWLLTGFIHLDGYMDVTDAVRSYRSLERRREILKDSHVGSFAVIGLVLLALTQYALLTAAPERADFRILALVPVVSRCGSALAVTVLPPMSTSQYAQCRARPGHVAALILQLLAALLAGFLLCGRYGLALLGCLGGYGLALLRGYCSLRGMNGDLAGYALTWAELAGVAMYALL